jgi:hypothetical protein
MTLFVPIVDLSYPRADRSSNTKDVHWFSQVHSHRRGKIIAVRSHEFVAVLADPCDFAISRITIAKTDIIR